MQWKKFSIHLETDGSFRLPVSKLNNRFFLQKNALVQETFFSTYLKKSILSKHIFILVKKTGHCLSKYKLHTNYWGQVFKQVSFITVTRKFSVSSNEQKGRLKTKFYSIGYYCTRNLSFIQNDTQKVLLWIFQSLRSGNQGLLLNLIKDHIEIELIVGMGKID